MRLQHGNVLRMLALSFALGGSSLLSMACDHDSKAENAAEKIGDAADDAADEVGDAAEDAADKVEDAVD